MGLASNSSEALRQALNYGRTLDLRVTDVTSTRRLSHSVRLPIGARLASSRAKGSRRRGTSKERTVNTIFNDIADTLGNITSWDDVAAGLVCATFCAASASMFVVLFVGVA